MARRDFTYGGDYFAILEGAFLALRFDITTGRRRWRQILNLYMDREAFTSDLGNDRRCPGFFWRLRKRQHVVRAVLHRTTHASRSGAKASLRTSAESRLLSPGCQWLIPQVL